MTIDHKLLTPNKWSRPGKTVLVNHKTKSGFVATFQATQEVRGIAMHWVENPGTNAEFNRNYFEKRKEGHLGYGSAHYIMDNDHIVQCIPEDEIAFHVGSGKVFPEGYTELAIQNYAPYPSANLIGIELCHPTAKGFFDPETLMQAGWLCAGICTRYGLGTGSIIRHYDITGKICPKWWVEFPDGLKDFRARVDEILNVMERH